MPPAQLPCESSMWFFVIGDLFIFAVYFVLYMVYRGQHHALFLQSQHHLNQGIAVINTVVLLSSSLFVALATGAARNGKVRDRREEHTSALQSLMSYTYAVFFLTVHT